MTSFIHRDDFFNLTERWLWGRLEPDDGLLITKILICDGFVAGETLGMIAEHLLEIAYGETCKQKRIQFKGQLRDAICRSRPDRNARVEELVRLYETSPDFFYREAPINGAICLDSQDRLLGLYRIKRPRRIAEKANRYVANWIFGMVQSRAKEMAELRAIESAVPLEQLVTPQSEMDQEFIDAEKDIARRFKENTIRLDESALRLHDVAGMKIVANGERLSQLEGYLADHSKIRIIDRESFSGNYQANSYIIEVSWDKEKVCRTYKDQRVWERYLDRGIPEGELKRGLEPFLKEAKPTLKIELILSTFPDMVESELGNSLHEERIIAQRDNKIYRGYVPMNVEFLIEYLFAVGASPSVHIHRLPIKLWGRYLPDTVIAHIRELYRLPESELYC